MQFTKLSILFLLLVSQSIALGDDPDSAATAPAESKPAYHIGPDDVLAVNVWKEPEISRVLVVRPDGKINLPLIGEIQAAGLAPAELEQQLKSRLAAFIGSPETTVIVQEARSQRYNVLGEVLRPGNFMLKDTTTVLDAIANAGGFRDFAKTTKIYVLRKSGDGITVRLKFNYKDVTKGRRPEQNVQLLNGDTVVIP